jgi:hypothetical protein
MIPSKDNCSSQIERYLTKQAILKSEENLYSPALCLKLCVVIPALAEREHIGEVLDSLEKGSQRLDEAEVIVLINNPENAAAEVVAENQATMIDLQSRTSGGLNILAVDRASEGRAMDKKKAGVGLARRLGMDLALQRLHSTGNAPQAAIACLDAESPVAPGYIDAVLSTFAGASQPLGALCTYAHPLPEDTALVEAIVSYELWLRYYEFGLHLCGSLFAYTPIGSSMVASAKGYAMADGMPLKAAGEDFYFWQKLVKVNGLTTLPKIQGAKVFPKVRVSDRVPFGTGRAMQRCVQEQYTGYREVEPPEAFFALRTFLQALPDVFYNQEHGLEKLSQEMRSFLQEEGALDVFAKHRATYPSLDHFTLAIQQWFDGLRTIRYINEYSRKTKRVWILEAILQVLVGLGKESLVADLPMTTSEHTDWNIMQQWLERLRQL